MPAAKSSLLPMLFILVAFTSQSLPLAAATQSSSLLHESTCNGFKLLGTNIATSTTAKSRNEVAALCTEQGMQLPPQVFQDICSLAYYREISRLYFGSRAFVWYSDKLQVKAKDSGSVTTHNLTDRFPIHLQAFICFTTSDAPLFTTFLAKSYWVVIVAGCVLVILIGAAIDLAVKRRQFSTALTTRAAITNICRDRFGSGKDYRSGAHRGRLSDQWELAYDSTSDDNASQIVSEPRSARAPSSTFTHHSSLDLWEGERGHGKKDSVVSGLSREHRSRSLRTGDNDRSNQTEMFRWSSRRRDEDTSRKGSTDSSWTISSQEPGEAIATPDNHRSSQHKKKDKNRHDPNRYSIVKRPNMPFYQFSLREEEFKPDEMSLSSCRAPMSSVQRNGICVSESEQNIYLPFGSTQPRGSTASLSVNMPKSLSHNSSRRNTSEMEEPLYEESLIAHRFAVESAHIRTPSLFIPSSIPTTAGSQSILQHDPADGAAVDVPGSYDMLRQKETSAESYSGLPSGDIRTARSTPRSHTSPSVESRTDLKQQNLCACSHTSSRQSSIVEFPPDPGQGQVETDCLESAAEIMYDDVIYKDIRGENAGMNDAWRETPPRTPSAQDAGRTRPLPQPVDIENCFGVIMSQSDYDMSHEDADRPRSKHAARGSVKLSPSLQSITSKSSAADRQLGVPKAVTSAGQKIQFSGQYAHVQLLAGKANSKDRSQPPEWQYPNLD